MEAAVEGIGITRIISLRSAALVTLLLTFLLYIYVQKRGQNESDKRFAAQNHCQPAQKRLPFRWPLALDIFKMQYDAFNSGHLFEAQSRYFREHGLGKTYEVKLLGVVGVFTTHPMNVHAILVTNFEDYNLGSRREGFYPMIGEGIFTQDGNPWKHSRELMRRQFVRIQYQDLRVFEGPINDLLAGLKSSVSSIVDLQPFFFRFTLATTTSLLFGEPFAGLNPADHELFGKNFNYVGLVTAIRTRLSDWCWLYNPPKFNKSCSIVKIYAMRYVQHALTDMEENGAEAAFKRHPFIIDLYQELQDPSLVRDQLIHVLMAGRDTTACPMSWSFYLLVRHPKALARLRQVISSISADGEVLTRAQINKLTYLKCVLNEISSQHIIRCGAGKCANGIEDYCHPKGWWGGRSLPYAH